METPFQFKHFCIKQANTAMKVGTDGVLLGAWSKTSDNTVLDIGTGTGLIALMMAQRSSLATIDALELDEAAYHQSKENFTNSNWKDRLNPIHSSIQNFSPNKKYDLIISNPPFFINSYKAPEKTRSMARHTDDLPHQTLIESCKRLLKNDGTFSVILPKTEAYQFIDLAEQNELFLNRICKVKPNTTKPVKRIIMEFTFQKKEIRSEKLTIETDKRHVYTKDYITLTKDFYLKL